MGRSISGQRRKHVLLAILLYPIFVGAILANAFILGPSSSTSACRRVSWMNQQPNRKLSPYHYQYQYSPSPLVFSPLSIKSSSAPSKVSSSLVSLYLSSDNEQQTENKQEKEELTHERIVELVEVSFIKACMQLASGYVDVLKLFIVSIKAAYEYPLSADQLIYDVQFNCPVNTAGRDLFPEEIQLRSTWILATYLLLEYLEHEKKGAISNEKQDDNATAEKLAAQVQTQYSNIFPVIVRLHSSQGTFKDALKQSETVLDYPEGIQERAIVSQTLRVLWHTITVLKEEQLADPDSPPRPNIPGI